MYFILSSSETISTSLGTWNHSPTMQLMRDAYSTHISISYLFHKSECSWTM